MESLTRLGREISALKDQIRERIGIQAADRAAELDQEERRLARAIELAGTDAAVRAAWRQSAYEQRLWFKQLISEQLQHLPEGSPTRAPLHTLSRMVEASE